MTDVYKIAVKLSMTSNATAVLGALSKQLLGVDAQVKALEGKFGRLHTAIIGALAATGGVAIGGALVKVAQYGDALLDQQNKLIRAGRTHAEVAAMTAKAYERIAKAVPTATAADMLRVANQMQVVTGDWGKAVSVTPDALKIEALLANVTGKSAEGSGHALWRAIEMHGLTAGTPAQQAIGQKLLESLVRDIAASGGKLTANDYQVAAKRGGAYWQHSSPEFLAGPMSVVTADMGGAAAGTTLATFGQFLSGATTLSKQQFQALRSLGLIDLHKVTTDRGGRVNTAPGAIRGSLEYGDDYFLWTQKMLLPALARHGIGAGPERDSILAKIGRNRNVTRMLTMFTDEGFLAQIAKDLEVFHKSMGLDRAYDEYVKHDPKGVKAGFNAQYESMMQAIGAPLMQAAIPVMRSVTDMFTNLGAVANRHPGAIQKLGIGLAGLGAALTVGGAAAIMAALGPAGWIAAGIVGLGAAIAVLNPAAFKAMVQDFRDFATGVASLRTSFDKPIPELLAKEQEAGKKLLLAMADSFKTGIMGLPALLLQPLQDAMQKIAYVIHDAIVNAISNAMRSIGKEIGGLFHHSSFQAPGVGSYMHKASYSAGSVARLASVSAGLASTVSPPMLAASDVVPRVSSADTSALAGIDRLRSRVVPQSVNHRPIVVEHETQLDGRVLAKSTTRYQVEAAVMPLGIHGGPDDYGSFVGSGTTFQPA